MKREKKRSNNEVKYPSQQPFKITKKFSEIARIPEFIDLQILSAKRCKKVHKRNG